MIEGLFIILGVFPKQFANMDDQENYLPIIYEVLVKVAPQSQCLSFLWEAPPWGLAPPQVWCYTKSATQRVTS